MIDKRIYWNDSEAENEFKNMFKLIWIYTWIKNDKAPLVKIELNFTFGCLIVFDLSLITLILYAKRNIYNIYLCSRPEKFDTWYACLIFWCIIYCIANQFDKYDISIISTFLAFKMVYLITTCFIHIFFTSINSHSWSFDSMIFHDFG